MFGPLVRTSFAGLIELEIILGWEHASTGQPQGSLGSHQGLWDARPQHWRRLWEPLLRQQPRCPHLPGATYRLKETKAISNGVKPWKCDSWRASDKCRLSFRKQQDWEKKTLCYASRLCPRGILVANAQKARGQTRGLIQNRYIPGLRGSSLRSTVIDLRNDPRPCTKLPKMKA